MHKTVQIYIHGHDLWQINKCRHVEVQMHVFWSTDDDISTITRPQTAGYWTLRAHVPATQACGSGVISLQVFCFKPCNICRSLFTVLQVLLSRCDNKSDSELLTLTAVYNI